MRLEPVGVVPVDGLVGVCHGPLGGIVVPLHVPRPQFGEELLQGAGRKQSYSAADFGLARMVKGC